MDLQTIITGIIILLAAVYVGVNVRRKVAAFSPKTSSSSSSCAADCGCDSKN